MMVMIRRKRTMIDKVIVAVMMMIMIMMMMVTITDMAELSVVASVVVAMIITTVGCLTSQQHASVFQGRICTDNLTCCHTEIEVADYTFSLTQSQYTDTGPTSPSADPITPGAWQGSHWSASL